MTSPCPETLEREKDKLYGEGRGRDGKQEGEVKPVKAFAAINPPGDLCVWSVRRQAKQVRYEVSGAPPYETWSDCLRQGWRVVPITITVTTKKK